MKILLSCVLPLALFGLGSGSAVHAQCVLTPPRLEFPETETGSTSWGYLEVVNTGDVEMSLAPVATGDFEVYFYWPSALAPGESGTISMRFRPTSFGAHNGTLSISDGACYVPLAGNATHHFEIELLSAAANFGIVELGRVATSHIAIVNKGTVAVVVDEISACSAFEFAVESPVTIDPGATMDLGLVYTAQSVFEAPFSFVDLYASGAGIVDTLRFAIIVEGVENPSELGCSAEIDFDDLLAGVIGPGPGYSGHGGWFRLAGSGGGYGEIQSFNSSAGMALHQFVPSSNQCGEQIADAVEVSCDDLGPATLITLGVDFLAATSSSSSSNPYWSSLVCGSTAHPGFEILGLSLYGGNGSTRSTTGVNVGLSFFNGADNNEQVQLTVGRNLRWDAWHHVRLALDLESDSYLYVEVDGEHQDLTGIRPPRSYASGEWVRGQRIDQLVAAISPCPWGVSDATDDHVYWDNIAIEVGSPSSSVRDDRPSPETELRFLGPSFPNPIHSTCSFSVTLPRSGQVSLLVYDLAGRVVDTAFTGVLDAGTHGLSWSPKKRKLGDGVYFLRLDALGRSETRKILILE